MEITLQELMNRLTPGGNYYLLVCGEAVVFDQDKTLTYVPKSNFTSAVMNPLADFKTLLGHALLWSQQVVVDVNSADMLKALEAAGFRIEEAQERSQGWVARLVPPAAHE